MKNKEPLRINIRTMLSYMEDLFAEHEYVVQSDCPPINNIRCKLKKGPIGFELCAESMNLVTNMVAYQHVRYGWHLPFTLKSENRICEVKDGVGQSKVKLFQNMQSNCILWDFESNWTSESSYYRALYPVEDFHCIPADFLPSTTVAYEQTVQAGYVSLKIFELPFAFFHLRHENHKYLVIDCKEKCDHSQFRRVSEAIIECFAILSGYLQQKEVILVRSDVESWDRVTGVSFKKLDKSKHGWGAINPEMLRQLQKVNHYTYMPIDVFSKLIEDCCLDERQMRAVKIITESAQNTWEIQAAAFSVALETIKNIVVEQNEPTLNPFANKESYKALVRQIKLLIDNIPNDHFNNKQSVLKRIDNLNQLGNMDSIYKVFEILDINLNEDDKRCLNKRNEFLHGKIPFEGEPQDIRLHQLEHIVLKLHFLLAACLLKKAGYSGFLLNNLKVADLREFHKSIDEPIFRKV